MQTRTPRLNAFALSTIILSALVTTPNSANALSCARPQITGSFEQWSQSDRQYVLVRGMLSPRLPLPEAPPPSGDINAPNPPAPHLYEFSGVIIGKAANRPLQVPVMVTPTCIAAWCAGHFSGSQNAVMALEVNGPNYSLTYGPCGGQVFTGDLDASEAALRACLNGRCPPPTN